MTKDSKNIFRQAISFLLAFCLLTVFAAYEPVSGQYAEKNQKPHLLASAFMERAFGTAVLNQRVDFSAFDALFKDALIHEQETLDFSNTSVSFPDEFSDRFARFAGQATITIRAPPCFPSL